MKRTVLMAFACSVLCAAAPAGDSSLPAITLDLQHDARRVSSHDTTGGNVDWISLPAGARIELATLTGPGLIRHLWFTLGPHEADWLDVLWLEITFDGAAAPAVAAPFGPFFGLGHDQVVDVHNDYVTVMAAAGPYEGNGAFNCYFPMPFYRQARVAMVNHSTADVRKFFYHVDWQARKRLPRGVRYFHATYREETTIPVAGKPTTNPDGAEDYVILDATGTGHYLGCTLHVTAHESEPGKWYEGDDRFIVDGEPQLLGTGAEDYFNMAWGVRRPFQARQFGASYHAWNPGEKTMWQYGRFSLYRFHRDNPVTFRRSLRVSLEHGHANDAGNLFRSVAYWYARRP